MNRRAGPAGGEYVPRVTREDVLRVLRRDLPPEHHDAALEQLDSLAPGTPDAARARVQLAVLKLCGGRIERLPECIRLAATDFRDALAAAEYPGFLEVGFTGVERMKPAAVRKLQEADWKQYAAWLERE